MRVDVFTIFPSLVTDYASASILGRAQATGALALRVWDLRDYATDAHRSVDDAPLGGGPGMVLLPGPIFAAVEDAERREGPCRPLYALTPSGRRFDQSVASELAGLDRFGLLCGRYEGIDERVLTHCCDGELSVGDVVLAGGELAALVVIEAVARLQVGVLGNDASPADESFADGLLEYPQYTRPAEFRGLRAPDLLLSGDHGRIARWRRAQALRRTRARRPDLLDARGLRDDERALLDEAPDEEPDDDPDSSPTS